MRIGRIIKQRLRSLLYRSQVDFDLQSEIELHLEQLVKERMADGMSESEALLAAKREFGPVAVTEEQCRDMRQTRPIEELKQDLGFAFRMMKKSPVFTLSALFSLALGIGANTAIFSFMDAIMMRALPVPDPQNLVVVNWRCKEWPKVAHSQHGDGYKDTAGRSVSGTFPYPAFELLRDHNDTLSTLFAFASAGPLNLIVGSQAFLAEGEYVSGSYFSGIGAPPAAGRLIGNDDDRPGAPGVAVISYRLWQERFNGATNAVGQSILVNRTPFTIAGITAPEFYGLNPRDSQNIFLPLHAIAYLDPRARNSDWFQQSNNYWVEMMGRLRQGVTLRKAEIPVAGKFHSFAASSATKERERTNLPELWLEEGGSGLDALRRQYSKPLSVLIGMSSLILVIACANVANLLLSRAMVRRREIAVRLSLGAGRLRIIRQLLTESVLLAFLGGLMGLLVTTSGIRFLTWLLANGNEDFTLHARIDARILLFAILVSLATGIIFGLAPAIQATKVDVIPALKNSHAAALRLRRFSLPFGLSHVLVVGQIGLSLSLVIAAGLFVRTIINLHSVSLGFNTEKLLLFNLDAKQAGYDDVRRARFYESLRERFANMPGVRAATMTDMPLASGSSNSDSIIIPGMPTDGDRQPSTSSMIVGPSFFETMQIAVLLGRPIDEQDTTSAPHVAVVNEVFAKMFFPGRNVLGQHFTFNDKKPIDVQIIGLARNSLYRSIKSEIPPVAYLPWSQTPDFWFRGNMYFELRTLGDPLALANSVRQVVHEMDPNLPVADVHTHVQYINRTIAPERIFANLCTCFGLLALLIACVGLYGNMAYAVARRTNEIGIRIALGAQRTRIIWMIQREVLALSSIGIVIGLSVAREMTRLIASFLFGIRPDDVAVFGMSGAVLVLCAVAASYAPAWRSSRTDPMQALRNE